MANLIQAFQSLFVSHTASTATLPAKERVLKRLFTEAQGLRDGESRKVKVRIEGARKFSFIIGKGKEGVFVTPYSEKKESPWEGISRPVLIREGTFQRALKAKKYTPSGEEDVTILKAKEKDEPSKKRLSARASSLRDLHAQGTIPCLEKGGDSPNCRRGVLIKEHHATSLSNLHMEYTTQQKSELLGKIIKGLLGAIARGYYPMDVKQSNILMTGDEVVLSDLEGMYKKGVGGNKYPFHSPSSSSLVMGEVGRLVRENASEEKITEMLEKELSFLVALLLLRLHEQHTPYYFAEIQHSGWGKTYTYNHFREENRSPLEAYLTQSGYTPYQVNTLVNALSNDPHKRPSLMEMAIEFPFVK